MQIYHSMSTTYKELQMFGLKHDKTDLYTYISAIV